jgi:hypothetical protein
MQFFSSNLSVLIHESFLLSYLAIFVVAPLLRLRTAEVNTRNDVLPATSVRSQNRSMRPVAFGEALPAGTRLTLFSDDKSDRFFTVIKF